MFTKITRNWPGILLGFIFLGLGIFFLVLVLTQPLLSSYGKMPLTGISILLIILGVYILLNKLAAFALKGLAADIMLLVIGALILVPLNIIIFMDSLSYNTFFDFLIYESFLALLVLIFDLAFIYALAYTIVHARAPKIVQIFKLEDENPKSEQERRYEQQFQQKKKDFLYKKRYPKPINFSNLWNNQEQNE